MGTEIERKFLLASDQWRALPTVPGRLIRQSYLSSVKERTVRVRTAGDRAWITVKGITQGASRAEFEYPIPVADANLMLDALCEKPLIENPVSSHLKCNTASSRSTNSTARMPA